MSSKMPPVPPASISPKGPAVVASRPDDPSVDVGDPQKANPDKIGQAGNTHVNTTNQGLQQDR